MQPSDLLQPANVHRCHGCMYLQKRKPIQIKLSTRSPLQELPLIFDPTCCFYINDFSDSFSAPKPGCLLSFLLESHSVSSSSCTVHSWPQEASCLCDWAAKWEEKSDRQVSPRWSLGSRPTASRGLNFPRWIQVGASSDSKVEITGEWMMSWKSWYFWYPIDRIAWRI